MITHKYDPDLYYFRVNEKAILGPYGDNYTAACRHAETLMVEGVKKIEILKNWVVVKTLP